MSRWLGIWLVLVVAISGSGVGNGVGSGQEPSKKGDEPKSNSPAKKGEETNPNKNDLPSTGGKVWASPEQFKELQERYQKLLEKWTATERLLKKERLLPSACKLSGRLDGEVAALRAEYAFSTIAPVTYVFLGLKNGFLTDEGQLDDGTPHLEWGDDGCVARIDKEGSHRLTLNFRVQLSVKRAVGTAAGNERGFDLGLPGSAVTTLSLELPAAIKDLRTNDLPAVLKNGRWEATIGAQKSLSVLWREPVTTASAAQGPSSRANLKIKIEEGRVELSGDWTLEDAKNPTREWQIQLPPQVKIEPAAGSVSFTAPPVEGKPNTYAIKATEPADKITLAIQGQYLRTAAPLKLPIGPFLAQGTATNGTILVQSAAGALRGQRLVYHRFGEIYQRDPPKSAANVENLAYFQFWNATASSKTLSPAKATLELEWKTEKGQVDASAEHDVRLHKEQGHWVAEVESKFHAFSANTAVDTLELQMPPMSLVDLLWLGAAPGTLRLPLALLPHPALLVGVSVADDGGPIDVAAVDGQHRVRLKLSRPIGKELVVKTSSRYLAASDAGRLLLDVPKLVGVVDRGAKITISAPTGHELLVGPAAAHEPVYDQYQQSLDQMPATLDVVWRESRQERPARAVADLYLHDNSVHVRQTLQLPVASWAAAATQTGQVGLQLPHDKFTFAAPNPSTPVMSTINSVAWVKLPPKSKDSYELLLEYDVKLDGPMRDIVVPLLWPVESNHREAKLRVWTEPGVAPILAWKTWNKLPLELGGDETRWPALVASGVGRELPVVLSFDRSGDQRLPAMNADRALLQAHLDDDGNQSYRCRFLVKKIATTHVDVDLPVAHDQAQVHFKLGGAAINFSGDRQRARVALPDKVALPAILEITYQIPAGLVEGRRSWQTPLLPPRIQGDSVVGVTRWSVTYPGNQVPFVLGAAAADYRWTLKGWLLTPEPSATSAELDSWIGADGDDGESPNLVWWRPSVEPQRVYHFPRQFWLILCSGLVLVLGVVIMLTSLPRFVLGLLVVAALAGILALGWFHEYLLPVVFFGCQPGLVVLITVGLAHWYLQDRYRRQLAFTPTFSRVPQGSTLIRGQNRPRDPSTVDAPAGMPSSAKGTGQ